VLLPLEEDAIAVVRPANAGGLVADQRGAAHDVIHRESELIRRTGLKDKKDSENEDCNGTHLEK
jgi:hypothetical protein